MKKLEILALVMFLFTVILAGYFDGQVLDAQNNITHKTGTIMTVVIVDGEEYVTERRVGEVTLQNGEVVGY